MTKSFNWSQNVTYQNVEAKRSWHATGRKRMAALAALLGLPKGTYDVRSNKAGMAVSGEVTLHGDDIYVQACQSCMGNGMGIIVRRCNGRKDYSGGVNNWLKLDLLNDIPELARVVALIRKHGP